MGMGLAAWAILGLAAWGVLGILTFADAAQAAEQDLSGQVVRIDPDAKRVILNVPDGHSAEGKQMTVWVDKSTRLTGVGALSELKTGASVDAKVQKSWYGDKWILRRLIYTPPSKPRGPSPTESAQLQEIENKAAQGQAGDIEVETKRQALEESNAQKTI